MSSDLGEKQSLMSSASVTIDTTGFSESSFSPPPTFSSHEFLPSYSTTDYVDEQNQSEASYPPYPLASYPPDPLASFGRMGRGLEDSNSSSNDFSEDQLLRLRSLTTAIILRANTNRGGDRELLAAGPKYGEFGMKPLKNYMIISEQLRPGPSHRERHNSFTSRTPRSYRTSRSFSRTEKSVSSSKNLILKQCFICSDRIVMPPPVSFESELSVTDDRSPGELTYNSTTDVTDTIPTDTFQTEPTDKTQTETNPTETISTETIPSGTIPSETNQSDSIPTDTYPEQTSSAKHYAKCCPKCCRGSQSYKSKSDLKLSKSTSDLFRVQSRPDLELLKSNPLMAVSALEENTAEKNRTSADISELSRCDSDSALYRAQVAQVTFQPTFINRGCSPIIVLQTRLTSTLQRRFVSTPSDIGTIKESRTVFNAAKRFRGSIAFSNDEVYIPKKCYSFGNIEFAATAYQRFKIRKRLQSENSRISTSNPPKLAENPILKSIMYRKNADHQLRSNLPPRISHKHKPPSSIALLAFSTQDSIHLGLPDEITPGDDDVGAILNDSLRLYRSYAGMWFTFLFRHL